MHVDPATLPMVFFVSAANKSSSTVRKTEFALSSEYQYPDMTQLMEFVQNGTSFDDLKQDRKILDLLLAEDQKIYDSLTSANSVKSVKNSETLDVKDEEIGDVSHGKQEQEKASEEFEGKFGAQFEALKKRVLAKTQDDEVNEENSAHTMPEETVHEFGATAGENGQFPGSFDEMKDAQNIIRDEVNALLKSTGFKVPDSGLIDTSKIQTEFPWYTSALLLMNFVIVSIFGDGYSGAAVLLTILFSLFWGIPSLLRLRRRRLMVAMATTFYKQHEPGHLNRVEMIVDAFMNISNGHNKLYEELCLKYVVPKKIN